MSVLIIAEKPSVAKNIANVLGANQKNDGYFSGNGYLVSFCFGHLLTLYDAKDYDNKYEKWNMANFPLIPEQFKYKLKDDAGVKKQFKIIASLINQDEVEYIVNAADADREGELLSTLVIKATKTQKPVKRLWISEQTPEAIRKGLAEVKDSLAMRPLQDAGYARQMADWLIGINLTTVATLGQGNGSLLRVGRVIIPTLKLIYDREMAIENFKPVPYFELKATFGARKGVYQGTLIKKNNETRFEQKESLLSIVAELQNKAGTVIEKKVSKVKENSPKLFNLTDLQAHISKKYKNWTADKVLKVAQNLYEKKFLTYPRTSSRSIEETLIPQMEKVLNAMVKDTPFEAIAKFTVIKGVFDNSKVDSHSAITPTYLIPSTLSEDEKTVYEEVKKRFISQFMPVAEFEVTEIKTGVEKYLFLTKGKVLKNPGWKVLYENEQSQNQDSSKENEDKALLPEVAKEEVVQVTKLNIESKKTSPPKPYTEASLLLAMENCGKNIDEEELESVLKGFSLGTPATRATIINNLITSEYIQRKGKTIAITERGIKIVEELPLKNLFDTNFTGGLEKKLKDIELNQFSKQDFMAEINQLVIETVNSLKKTKASIGDGGGNKPKEVLGSCPACGKNVIEGNKAYGCLGFKEGCKFGIWKENALLKKLALGLVPKKLVKEILSNPELKTKISLNAKITEVRLSEKDGRWNLEFDLANQEKVVLGRCPECGRDVVENAKGFGCVGYGDKENPCKFSLWKEDKFWQIFNKKLTAKMAKDILAKKTIKVNGLISPKTNKKFDAEILFQKNEKGYWGFKFKEKNAG